MRVGVDVVDDAVAPGHDDHAGVAGDLVSMPVPTSGASGTSSGTAWRCMFEPIRARLASSCSRNGISDAATDDHLLRRHVHVLDLVRRRQSSNVAARCAADDAVVGELAALVESAFGLGDDVPAPPRSRRAGTRSPRSPCRSRPCGTASDEAVLVDRARSVDERRDQADVRAFRRLDRADAAVVRGVDVAHLEAGALAVQTARARGPTAGACASARRAGSSGP